MAGRLAQIDEVIATNDYRIANMRAGYVYVISNVGAFGPNIVKIGMTRRRSSRSGSRTGRLSGIGGAAQQLACQATCARACPSTGTSCQGGEPRPGLA